MSASTTPTLLPADKPPRKWVALEDIAWNDLSEIAEFHTQVFTAMGEKETVSRNDIIASFLDWARESYWDDKGGKPTSVADRDAKIARHAEKLKQLKISRAKK